MSNFKPKREPHKFTTTFRLLIEYDGTRYQGWQEQDHARTVAGEIRAAASEVLGEAIELGGAGRTDSGVHALGQVAHLRTTKNPKPEEIFREINRILPPDINIVRLSPTYPHFHARHDAVARYYLYQITTERTAFGKKYVWWIKNRLDMRNMKQAAQHFHGFHDFANFSERDEPHDFPERSRRHAPKSDSKMVDVHHISLEGVQNRIYFRIGASHFLWKMVRRIVGTLVQVGQGNLRPAEVIDLMQNYSPEIAKWTAPPSGLFLEQIEYPDDKKREGRDIPWLGAPRP
ncbi:MAG: tRNA pseudouridine(38-40) synthase TruA [Blastocatellia bacterium]|nr:tRNA pseudouridine(38-40) synthase TruA [Blastocatellia bacterium]